MYEGEIIVHCGLICISLIINVNRVFRNCLFRSIAHFIEVPAFLLWDCVSLLYFMGISKL